MLLCVTGEEVPDISDDYSAILCRVKQSKKEELLDSDDKVLWPSETLETCLMMWHNI
jgi:predicted component of type VI protein secretion system